MFNRVADRRHNMKNLIKIKGMLIISLFVCFTNDVDSQTNFIFGKQFGSDKDGVAFNPVTDKFGNAGGNLFKSIEKPEGHDMFLLKLSMCNSQPNQ